MSQILTVPSKRPVTIRFPSGKKAQQPREEILGKVLRLCRIVSLAPDDSIKRRPISAA